MTTQHKILGALPCGKARGILSIKDPQVKRYSFK